MFPAALPGDGAGGDPWMALARQHKEANALVRQSSNRPLQAGGDSALEDGAFDSSVDQKALNAAVAAMERARAREPNGAGEGSGAGESAVLQKALKDVIAERVDSVLASPAPRTSTWRHTSVRAQAFGGDESISQSTGSSAPSKPLAIAQKVASTGATPSKSSKGSNFGVSRLGIPSPNSGGGKSRWPQVGAPSTSLTALASAGAVLEAPSPLRLAAAHQDPSSQAVHYIHIPQHAVKDFRAFAKEVAAEACRDVATNNPYVQALNRHRAELQYPIIPVEEGDAPKEQPTLEQLLSTQREALSTISTVPRSPSWNEVGNEVFFGQCGQQEVVRMKSCGLFGTGAPLASLQCCTSRGDLDEAPAGDLSVSVVDGAILQQEPVMPTATLVPGVPPRTCSPVGTSTALDVFSKRTHSEKAQCAAAAACASAQPGDVAAGPPTL